jgi:lipoprotein-releasing system permease protein
VDRIDRVGFAQGVLAGAAGESEVTLRGAPPGAGALSGAAAELERGADGVAGVLLGAELARGLGAGPGDLLRLTALGLGDGRPKFTFRSLRVARTFETGFSEFDRSWAVVAPETLAGLPGGGVPSYEVAVADARRAPEIAETIRARIGPEALIADWTQLNRELFAALALQQPALFLLLGLIVVVATFNVASTLVVLVRERRRDLGVLAALGLPPAEIRQVFLLYGLLLGGLGTGLGLALAAAVAWTVDRFELLSFGPEVAEIYFLSSVPMRLALRDVVAIALLSIGVTTLACWLPARRAGRIEPATALQYE